MSQSRIQLSGQPTEYCLNQKHDEAAVLPVMLQI